MRCCSLFLLLFLAAGCASGPRRGILTPEDVPPGWRLQATDHYQVLTDASAEDARMLAERLEGVLALYRKILPTERELPRFPVRVFKTYAGYRAYGGEEGTAGCYDQSTGDLVLTQFEGYGGGDPMIRQPSPHELVTTAHHEAWHQYFHWYLDTDEDPPVWFDEGMADYFGQARTVPSTPANAEAPDAPGGRKWSFHRTHAAWLDSVRAAIATGKYMPLRKFVHLSRHEYYETPSLCYPQGWALVHFLINSDDPRTNEVSSVLVRALQEGAESAKAVDEAFAGMDWAKLEEAWKKYVGTLD